MFIQASIFIYKYLNVKENNENYYINQHLKIKLTFITKRFYNLKLIVKYTIEKKIHTFFM